MRQNRKQDPMNTHNNVSNQFNMQACPNILSIQQKKFFGFFINKWKIDLPRRKSFFTKKFSFILQLKIKWD
jgi:hypothetical protein